jgi:hypothetical protein
VTLDWAVLDRRAANGDLAGVESLLLAADERERRAFAATVEAGIRRTPPDHWWRGRHHPGRGYALAVIGTATTAAKAAALLGTTRIRETWARIPLDRFLGLARARELPWVGDLGVRLAAKIPPRQPWLVDWAFVAALLAEGGAMPSASEGVVRGWITALTARGPGAPDLADVLRQDPYLDLLLPGLFEIDGLGAELAVRGWGAEPSLLSTVALLAGEGRLDRAALLDATVDRLVRGDRPEALRAFTTLHDELAPTAD